MKKLLLITVLALTGCNEEERKRELNGINGQLPEGCVVADVGGYGAISHVLVVICKGYDTTSTNYYWTSGKMTKSAATLQIADNGVSR